MSNAAKLLEDPAVRSQLERMQELLDKQVPLHPDLTPCLCQIGGCVPALRHPLFYAVPYLEPMNGIYNEQYEHKRQAVAKALKTRNWPTYVFLHERPYRFEALHRVVTEHADEIDAQTFWDVFGSCWTDTENMWQMEREVRSLLEIGYSDYCDGWRRVMTDDEHTFLDNLPDEFVVYRGHQKHNQMGLSWTLSRWKARWFARRFDSKGVGVVSRAIVNKSAVIGCFLGRNEFEIAVLPENLPEVKKVRPLQRPPKLKPLFERAVGKFALGPRSYHGPEHWESVERNVIAIAKVTPGADMMVCRLFAILHDTQRVNEDEDKLHGTRAARFIKSLHDQGQLSVIDDEQLNKLLYACVNHTKGQTSDDPTIGACWDADRMDLVRVGDAPDTKFFSTKAGKELLWRI